MVGPAKKHVDELLKLSPDDRSEAAELLLCSLDDDGERDDPDVVAAGWASEVERRIDEDAPGVSSDAVFSEARARLQRRS